MVTTTTAASGLKPEVRHLMSKNFSAPISAPKPACDDDVGPGQRDAVGDDAVVSVRDVAERTTVDERRPALHGLHEVRLDRVLQQHGHRTGHLEVLGGDDGAIVTGGQHDPAESGSEILEVGGEGEDRHDLGRDRDDEAGLAGVAVLPGAQADHDLAQRAVADVEHPWPHHRPGVDPELVAVVDVVVDEGRRQVMRRPDGVHIAGQVEVEVLHRDHL